MSVEQKTASNEANVDRPKSAEGTDQTSDKKRPSAPADKGQAHRDDAAPDTKDVEPGSDADSIA